MFTIPYYDVILRLYYHILPLYCYSVEGGMKKHVESGLSRQVHSGAWSSGLTLLMYLAKCDGCTWQELNLNSLTIDVPGKI